MDAHPTIHHHHLSSESMIQLLCCQLLCWMGAGGRFFCTQGKHMLCVWIDGPAIALFCSAGIVTKQMTYSSVVA